MLFSFNCSAQFDPVTGLLKKEINSRFLNLLDFPIDSVSIPRSLNLSSGVIKKVKSKDWTSGFYAGNLWQIYKLTGDIRYKEKAALWNAFIEKEKCWMGVWCCGLLLIAEGTGGYEESGG